MGTNPKVEKLLAIARGVGGIAAARKCAEAVLPEFPHNGCATFLSCLLEAAGIDCGIHEGAGDLAKTLAARGWERVSREGPLPGDVAVTEDDNGNGLPDHIFLIVQPLGGADACLVADNQCACLHVRYLSGRGRTPTAYMLRAPA